MLGIVDAYESQLRMSAVLVESVSKLLQLFVPQWNSIVANSAWSDHGKYGGVPSHSKKKFSDLASCTDAVSSASHCCILHFHGLLRCTVSKTVLWHLLCRLEQGGRRTQI